MGDDELQRLIKSILESYDSVFESAGSVEQSALELLLEAMTHVGSFPEADTVIARIMNL